MTTNTLDIKVRSTHWDDPAAQDLRAKQREEILKYAPEAGKVPTAADISFFLVLELDVPIACGGLRRLDNSTAEVKRMYVSPDFRGTGIAARVLEELENEALHHGWTTLTVETGVGMPAARRFYEKHGYHEIPLYGDYIGSAVSVCYSKDLNNDRENSRE